MSPTLSPALGAELSDRGSGVTFRCFAAAENCSVQVVNEASEALFERELRALGDGYFEGFVPDASDGALYYFVVDGRRLTDPYARHLPFGVHGPARVVRPRYERRYAPPRRQLAELVIYELHIGTFTPAGTFASATERLGELASLGVTAVQLMPVAAFAGERGWGYDGVALYAPHAPYGAPDDLRRLVDEAHRLGLSVLLDVVYNHFGPAGNYLTAYSPEYFCEDAYNVWGQAPNYAHPAMRRLILDNARYWLDEFGFDGLRLDATHAIVDHSPRHLLDDLADIARSYAPVRWLIAEDERNHAELVTRVGLSAVWADDFHHQVRVTLTEERSGYYAAYEPSIRDLAEVINRGWLYTGQVYAPTGKRRGTSADDLPAAAFVYCIQNHDQIGNRAMGDRLPPGDLFRSASLLLLFLPMTPLLFMGQEWAATTPFLYFTDHDAELGRRIRDGRRREFADFKEFSDLRAQANIPDPQDLATFVDSKLRWDERQIPEHARTLELYRAALALRRDDPVWRDSTRDSLFAEVVSGALVVHRSLRNSRRVLVMNLTDSELSISSLHTPLQLEGSVVQLSSVALPGDALPPGAAVVLASRE